MQTQELHSCPGKPFLRRQVSPLWAAEEDIARYAPKRTLHRRMHKNGFPASFLPNTEHGEQNNSQTPPNSPQTGKHSSRHSDKTTAKIRFMRASPVFIFLLYRIFAPIARKGLLKITNAVLKMTSCTFFVRDVLLYACRRGQGSPEKKKGENAMLIAACVAAAAVLATAAFIIIL